MKRILLITIALAAIISCSKTTPAYELTGEIMISPVSENVTKSMMSSDIFQGESFKVWSWYSPVKAQPNAIPAFQAGFAGATPTTSIYVDEKPFVERDAANNRWGGATPYYWPSTGSLIFAGYHAPNLAEDQVDYIFTETENKMTFSGVSNGTVADSGYAEDIMYFNMTPSSYNNSSLQVSMEFNHALSWITVTLAKRVDPVIEADIIVEEVYFTSLVTKGNGTVNGSDEIVWSPVESIASFKLPGLPLTVDYQVGEENGEKTYSPIVYKLQEHLFIPQDITGVLGIKYTIKSDDESKFTEVYEVNLTELKDGKAHNKWNPSKHYTYNLSIGTDEILVTPTVGEWASVGTDILIPLPDDAYDNLENNN